MKVWVVALFNLAESVGVDNVYGTEQAAKDRAAEINAMSSYQPVEDVIGGVTYAHKPQWFDATVFGPREVVPPAVGG
jgi:hypothetical protein